MDIEIIGYDGDILAFHRKATASFHFTDQMNFVRVMRDLTVIAEYTLPAVAGWRVVDQDRKERN